MKVSVGSDLHLEFGVREVHNDAQADVLILSGDIVVARDLKPSPRLQLRDLLVDRNTEPGTWLRDWYIHWFEDTCAQYDKVFYVMGNHEHYNGNFPDTINVLKENLDHIPNLIIMDNTVIEYNDVVFLGGTAWSDMNKNDPLTMMNIRNGMNDFQIIENDSGTGDGALFTPEDAVSEHKQFMSFLESNLDPAKKTVVISHHPPSLQFISDEYKSQYVMNGGYCSDHDRFIEYHPEIVLWTCGHVHTCNDVMIGNTRVLCNPCGYTNRDSIAQNFDWVTVEV